MEIITEEEVSKSDLETPANMTRVPAKDIKDNFIQFSEIIAGGTCPNVVLELFLDCSLSVAIWSPSRS
jgi:hypothetical protein